MCLVVSMYFKPDLLNQTKAKFLQWLSKVFMSKPPSPFRVKEKGTWLISHKRFTSSTYGLIRLLFLVSIFRLSDVTMTLSSLMEGRYILILGLILQDLCKMSFVLCLIMEIIMPDLLK